MFVILIRMGFGIADIAYSAHLILILTFRLRALLDLQGHPFREATFALDTAPTTLFVA